VSPAPEPAPEPAVEKQAVKPEQEVAPAQEKLPPPKEENKDQPKAAEEQPRKKNPVTGELEDLRNDGAAISTEMEEQYPFVEEVIDGDDMDVKNYLKKRSLKKKKSN